jgi:predicted O-methyltransferase YrrM
MARGPVVKSSTSVPWHARARVIAQAVGVEPRSFRRLRWIYKARVVHGYGASLSANLRFILLDPEPHNFTYEIVNGDDLAHWVASVAETDFEAAVLHLEEPASDAELEGRLRRATSGHWLWTKRFPPFGKRLGWYALVRLIKPRLVVETGVHDGLGSLLLLRALERNVQEGHPGRLVSFDVNPAAGWLVGSHPLWSFRIQASRDALLEMLCDRAEIDMFLYDGWHSYECERAELQMVAPHLTQSGVLLSDDAQVTGALADVCQANALRYLTVSLQSHKHFHPGAVLGAGRR